jgi:hypothetical protein
MTSLHAKSNKAGVDANDRTTWNTMDKIGLIFGGNEPFEILASTNSAISGASHRRHDPNP